MSMQIRKVVVVGAGTMGQQIAAACLVHGFETSLYDVNNVQSISASRITQVTAGIPDEIERQRQWQLLTDFRVVSDAAIAAAGADLLIEAVPEDIVLKRRLLHQFGQLCPNAIFTTNTSMFVASQMRRATPDEKKFAALHFTLHKPVEIMGHDRTAPGTIERLQEFVRAIGYVPYVCRHESPGAILNAMLSPLLGAAVEVSAKKLTSSEEIDLIWKQVVGGNTGPLALLDTIGLDTALMVTKSSSGAQQQPNTQLRIRHLQQFVDNGWLGLKTNRGFYFYQNNDPSTRSSHPIESIPTEVSVDGQSAPLRAPWAILSSPVESGNGQYLTDVILDPGREQFLADHVFKNTPLLPAAAVFELFSSCFEAATGRSIGQIRNLKFVNGLRFNRQTAENATIEMTIDAEDNVHCELRHKFCNRQGKVLDSRRLCATADIETRVELSAEVDRATVNLAKWRELSYSAMEGSWLGGGMQCLKRIKIHPPYAVGQIECHSVDQIINSADAERHRTISFVDAAFVSCMVYVQEYLGGGIQLPVSLDRIHLVRPPATGEVCDVNVECVSVSEADSEFNIHVVSGQEIILDVRGYKCHVIPNHQSCIHVAPL